MAVCLIFALWLVQLLRVAENFQEFCLLTTLLRQERLYWHVFEFFKLCRIAFAKAGMLDSSVSRAVPARQTKTSCCTNWPMPALLMTTGTPKENAFFETAMSSSLVFLYRLAGSSSSVHQETRCASLRSGCVRSLNLSVFKDCLVFFCFRWSIATTCLV